MLIINNEEEFLKTIGDTIHVWFGNGRSAEEGKEAILRQILIFGAPVIKGKLEKAGTKENKETEINGEEVTCQD